MIEFQYFDGCPNSDETLNNLYSLVYEGFIEETEIKLTKIEDAALAKELNFQGSPTILIDGIDIYTGKKPKGYAYSCRVYSLGDKHTGVLTAKYIKEKIDTLKGELHG